MDQKNTKNLASNLLSIGFLTKTPSPQAKRISSQLLSYLHTNHKKENKHLNHRPPKETTCSKKRDSDLWAKCFLELANEFLQKKEQLLKLNPSRRKLLREHLIKLSKTKQKPSLQSFVQSTPSDPLYKGLQAFSWEISIFYIFEFLLLKRWVAQGRVDKMPENPSGLNWKIHSHLKEKNRKQVLQQTQWQFLKINIYSWYQLGRGSWLKLENLARKTDISQKSADFLYEILLKERAIFKKIGIDCKHEYTKLAWELLLKQRQLDERVPVQQFPSIHRQSSSIIAGLCGGQALSSLQSIAHTYSLPSQIYALANTNLEIFLGEIIYLWNSNTKDLKTLKIELVEKNKKQKEKEIETLFSSPKQSILNEVHSVNHISIFLEDKKKTNLKIRKIPSLIRYLSNHGLILLVGEEYWPLAENRKSEKIRKFILNNTSIRFIVDLQQLITKQRSQTLPQCICVLEKNNSKELRDKNRPLIIKVKGNIEQQDDLQKFREKILECLEAPPAPCKTQSHSIPSTKMRLEVISAATTQEHLEQSPWIHLTDPSFYHVASRLNNHPKKLGQYGTLLPSSQSLRMKNGIFILEIPGKALYSCTFSEKEKFEHYKNSLLKNTDKVTEYTFILDQNIKEDPAFFSALINSAPIQLWYNLRWEQSSCLIQQNSRKERLKLIPVIKIFSSNMTALTKIQASSTPIVNINYARTNILKALQKIYSNPTRELQEEMYQYIIKLEYTAQIHLNIVREYSQHLCPETHIYRWNIPQEAPLLSPKNAILSLGHLKQTPLCRHPNVHITFTQKIADFIVKSYELSADKGNASELTLYSDTEPMLLIRTSFFLIQAILPEIEKRLGRPWEEISQRIFLPTDVDLMQNQIRDFQHSLAKELKNALEATQLLDCIFSKLLHLDTNTMDVCTVSALIRRQLFPKSNTCSLGRKKLVIFEQNQSVFHTPKESG